MKTARLLPIVVICALTIPSHGSPGTISESQRSPSADAYAAGQAGQQYSTHDDERLGVASVSFPTAERLNNTFLKFDVSHSGTLSNATLWLYALTVTGASHSLGIYAVPDDNWQETTLTWNNRPDLGSRLATSPASTGWLIFDVTSYVAAEAASDGVASFGIAIEPPYNFVMDVLEDRENSGTTGNRPYLVLETETTSGVTSFGAEPKLDQIELAWTTGGDDGIAGFNLYRALKPDAMDNGTVVKLNQEPIPADGGPSKDGSYAFSDYSALAGVRYYYWLEALIEGGTKTLYGPISATLEVWHSLLPAVLRHGLP